MNGKILNRLTEISIALKPKYQTGRAFHVTFILKKSKIISIGVNNLNKTHPKTKNFKYKNNEGYIASIHSELDACLKLGEHDLSHYDIVNIRINNNNKLDNSRPCCGCCSLLTQTGFNKLFYSTRDQSFSEYFPT